MKIEFNLPPNYHEIVKVLHPDHKTIFTYGDTIYSPFDATVTPDLMVHETVHMRQQGDHPDVWWDLYLKDNEFRLKEEVEAYRAQLEFFKRTVRDKNFYTKLLMKIAHVLASDLYGNIVTVDKALEMLS